MSIACTAIAIVYTVAFFIVVAAFVWQSNGFKPAFLTIPVRSTNPLYRSLDADGKPKINPKWFPAWTWHDARDLYSSRIFPRHGPILLCVWHGLVFGLVLAVVLTDFIGGPHGAPYDDYGAYLTNWTWYLLGLRAIYGFFVCLSGQRKLRKRKDKLQHDSDYVDPEYEPYKIGHIFYGAFSAIMPTATVCVAVGYWAATQVPENLTWDEPMKHGANAVVMLIELAISRLPMTTTWMLFPLAYTTVYTCFMILHWAFDGDWVYRRTDVTECINLIGYVCAPFVVLIAYYLLYLLTLLRNRLTRNRNIIKDDDHRARSPDVTLSGPSSNLQVQSTRTAHSEAADV